jgi:Ca-activated chloride channel family protein
MKQYSGISGRLAVGLIIFSMVFSACSSSSTQNSEIAQRKESPSYLNSNMASMNSAMASPESQTLAARDENYDGDYTKGEKYAEITENPFLKTSRAPLSTFSIDVDTASYAMCDAT